MEDVSEVNYKKVVRGGKVVKKVQCRPGYRFDGNSCVKMSSQELRLRGKAAKKAAKHRKGKKSQISQARKISLRIRKSRKL